jgi:pyruvate dehydrogenase E2 component (dihydrolipoamide acetyltransferase)
MMTEFRLPELGENVAGGDVSKVLVKTGDSVKEGDPLMELETDKAAIEVPSPITGIVREARVKAGAKAKVGEVIFIIESGTSAPVSPPAATSAMPVAAMGNHSKTETALPVVIPAKVKVPAPLPKKAEHPTSLLEIASPRKLAPAAPSVRRLAREIGVEIHLVKGTGPAGRISEADVKAFAKRKLTEPSPVVAGGLVAAAPLPDFSKWGEIDFVPMTNIRRKTAEHLAGAWATIPQVTQFDSADITELEQFRQKYSPHVEKAGGRLTVTTILLKVVASALKAFPQFNASVDMAKNEIVFKKYFHIGVAVETERGLLVPVIRDVERKNILTLALELAQISEKTRQRKLTLEEMQGGCFTITNLGGIGGTHFSPIVNSPEVAILGVSRSSLQPGYQNGVMVPKLLLPLSLSYDHRLIDGADGARFLRWIADTLQNPFLLMLEG